MKKYNNKITTAVTTILAAAMLFTGCGQAADEKTDVAVDAAASAESTQETQNTQEAQAAEAGDPVELTILAAASLTEIGRAHV